MSCLSAEASSSEAQQLTAEQQQKLKERARYAEETNKLRSEGKLGEAIAAAEKMLAIERGVHGDVHEDVAGSLELLAEMHEESEAWDAAREARQQVVKIKTALLGKDHYQVTDAHVALMSIEPLARLSPEEREQIEKAEQLNAQIVKLYHEGKEKSAIPLAEQVLVTRRELLGEEHLDYATSLNDVAFLYSCTAEYDEAERLYRQAMEIRRRVLGKEHPDYATSLNNLAVLYHSIGDYAKAKGLCMQAIKIRRRVLGEEHLDYAESLNSLALVYHSMGDYTKAETRYLQAMQKRVPRPQQIDGLPVDEFIARNADPIWLHQNEMWELMNRDSQGLGLHESDERAQGTHLES